MTTPPHELERRRKKYAEDPDYRQKMIRAASAYQRANRDKINARQRERYATDAEYRERVRAQQARLRPGLRFRKHGLSVKEYEGILARQRGLCGICERPFRGIPCIDHCHTTRAVRGLLCSKCNLGLGYYDDNPAFIRKAAHYLERWPRLSRGQIK